MATEMLALTSALAAFTAYNYTGQPTLDLADLATDRWWGPSGSQGNQDTKIYEYKVKYEDDMIADLKTRLKAVRANYQPLDGVGWGYGFNHLTLGNWTDYWLNKYDFKAQEAVWNKFPAYKTNIQGLDIVYFRVTPKVEEGTELVPLMILHGFPGSPREFWEAAPLLTAVSKDRKFAIDLIMPCMSGFGFSQAASQPGLGAAEMAVVMRNLMHRIGYTKFYVQGGDFGALTLNNLVTIFPDEVLGYHANWGVVLSPVAMFLQMVGAVYPALVVPNATYSRMYPIDSKFTGLVTGLGYLHLQATVPDSLGVALSDSPIGQLGFLLTGIATANNKSNANLADGGLLKSYTPEFLIDTMMFFWSTNSASTAMRLYANTFNKKQYGMLLDQVSTPVPYWVVQDTDEFAYQSPTILGLKFKNIVHVNDTIVAGHFLGYQLPAVYSDDVIKAITKFRELASTGSATKS